MSLSEHEITELLRLLSQTTDRELNCDECLSLVAEFAESQLRGKSVVAGLEAVEHHLALCGECREEYEALRRTLASIRGDGDA